MCKSHSSYFQLFKNTKYCFLFIISKMFDFPKMNQNFQPFNFQLFKNPNIQFSNIQLLGTEPPFRANLLLGGPPSRGLLYYQWLMTFIVLISVVLSYTFAVFQTQQLDLRGGWFSVDFVFEALFFSDFLARFICTSIRHAWGFGESAVRGG